MRTDKEVRSICRAIGRASADRMEREKVAGQKKNYKQKLAEKLAYVCFERGGSISGGSDTIWTLKQLTTRDLEYLLMVNTGEEGI